MNYVLNYQTETDEDGLIPSLVHWKTLPTFSESFRRCRWIGLSGVHCVDEFEKIRKAWSGNLSRDLDDIWYRTEITDE